MPVTTLSTESSSTLTIKPTLTSSTLSLPARSTLAVNLPFSNRPIVKCNKLDHFHLFSQLPTELRLNIYSLSLPQRILTIHYEAASNKFVSPTALPALLSTCVESRYVAKKWFGLYFGTASSEPRIYFSPLLDTVYLPRCGQMGYDENFRILKSLIKENGAENKDGNEEHEPHKLDQLHRLAIDHVDPNLKRPWESYYKASFLRGFPCLRELILVLSPGEEKTDPSVAPSAPPTGPVVTTLRDPRLPPEAILQIWWCFRKTFAIEEQVLKGVCQELGTDYSGFSLPTIRIKAKEVMSRCW